MKRILIPFYALLFTILTFGISNAQLENLTFDVRATNFVYLDTITGLNPSFTGHWNMIEFDIFIQQTNVPANDAEIMRFALGTYYINLNFGGLNSADTVGGYASYSYIPGSTTFTNTLALPTGAKCVAIAPSTDQGAFWPAYPSGTLGGYLNLNGNSSLGSMSDIQISGTFPGTKVGRYKLRKNITTASSSPYFPFKFTHFRWRVGPALTGTNSNPVSKIYCYDGLGGANTEVTNKGSWIMDTTNSTPMPLGGTYTIGTGGNYSTITSAVNDGVLKGISGPVIFNIKPGVYNERVVIDSIRGSSNSNIITFQSETGNFNDVLWQSNLSPDTSQFLFNLVTINKADYIVFKNIYFNSDNLASIFYLNQNCNDISILNNKITASMYQRFTSAHAVNSYNAQTNNLKINDNVIRAQYGISAGSVKSYSTQIINNQIECTDGITLINNDSLQIENNNIKAFLYPNNNSSPFGIEISGCNGYLKISKNKIDATGNGFGNGIRIYNSVCRNSIIVNNLITYDGGYGLTISNSGNINIYFNSIKSYSHAQNSNLILSNSSQCKVKNNIFGGFITSFSNNSNTLLLSDYNSFYFTPAVQNVFNLYFNGTGYTDLNQYRAASNNDFNSTSAQVFFVSSTDLHLAGPSIGDENLAGTPIAGITEDIDGDSRDPNFPYMGADEAVALLPEINLNLKVLMEGLYYPIFNHMARKDFVKVTIRNSFSPYAVVDSLSKKIDSIDFTAAFRFNIPYGTYYVVVNHLNSIEEWSESGVNFPNSNIINYDFTTGISQGYGSNMKMKGSRSCLFSGDIDQDGIIDATDLSSVSNDASSGVTGYSITDLNADEFVDASDLAMVENNIGVMVLSPATALLKRSKQEENKITNEMNLIEP